MSYHTFSMKHITKTLQIILHWIWQQTLLEMKVWHSEVLKQGHDLTPLRSMAPLSVASSGDNEITKLHNLVVMLSSVLT